MNLREILMLTPLYDIFGKRSYAQSGEDIVADVELGKKKEGFYVDVGAYHPKLFSNTYLFYKKGWSGICVDPNPTVEDLFDVVRPRDIFLNLGVAEEDGAMEYTMFDDGAANTFSESHVQKNLKEAGRKIMGRKLVMVMPLYAILDEYVSKKQKIDLLSIDVEGMDLEVLRSNDWKKYRPKVIICEDLSFDLGNQRKSELVDFLNEKGYRLEAKTPYSLIFVI